MQLIDTFLLKSDICASMLKSLLLMGLHVAVKAVVYSNGICLVVHCSTGSVVKGKWHLGHTHIFPLINFNLVTQVPNVM